MKITITGASGFVGKNLCNYLIEKNHKITPLSLRGNWKLENAGDAVIHLAGKAHDTSNTAEKEVYFTVNTDLTIALFQQFLKTDSRDFIYFSSVKAAADTLEGKLTEDTIPQPHTPYGKSKLKAEQYLLSQKLPDGKRLFVIRPCMIHGPGNKGNLNLLHQVVKKGIPWPLAAFSNERSFLSIDNLNYLISEILESPDLSSGIYNFADDEAVSTNDLVKLIAKVSGKKEKLWKINSNIISGIAKCGDFLKLPLNSERLKKLTESYVVDNSKIKNALKINDLPVSAKEGLEITLKSFLK